MTHPECLKRKIKNIFKEVLFKTRTTRNKEQAKQTVYTLGAYFVNQVSDMTSQTVDTLTVRFLVG